MRKARKKTMVDDPVVAEVRRIRAQIWKEAGGTAEGLIKLLNERQPVVRGGRARTKRLKRTG